MRRILLATAAALALSAPAHAQFAGGQFFGGQLVFDATAVARLAQEIGIQSESLTNLVSILQAGVSTLQQVEQLYSLTQRVEQDVAHLTNANSFAGALFQLRNSMASTGLMPAAITGNGRFGGAPASWASQFYGQNVVYLPQGPDWVGRRMSVDAQALANVQGQGAANLDNLEQRASGLSDLQSCIDKSATLQDEAACHSRIAAESAYEQNQAAQAANLAVLANTQREAAQQAQAQQNRQYLDHTTRDLCNAASSTGSANVSILCAAAGDGVNSTGAVAQNQ